MVLSTKALPATSKISPRSRPYPVPRIVMSESSSYATGYFSPSFLDPAEMYIRNDQYRFGATDGTTLRLQVPGEEGHKTLRRRNDKKNAPLELLWDRNAPVICYSRGTVIREDRTTWPDMKCNLSDAVMFDVLRSNLTPKQRGESWPQCFDPDGQPRKSRPHMGYPAFAKEKELSAPDKIRYAVWKQGYVGFGHFAAQTAHRPPGSDVADYVKQGKEWLEYPERRSIGDYVLVGDSKQHFDAAEPMVLPPSLEEFLVHPDLTTGFRAKALLSENARRSRWGLSPLSPPPNTDNTPVPTDPPATPVNKSDDGIGCDLLDLCEEKYLGLSEWDDDTSTEAGARIRIRRVIHSYAERLMRSKISAANIHRLLSDLHRRLYSNTEVVNVARDPKEVDEVIDEIRPEGRSPGGKSPRGKKRSMSVAEAMNPLPASVPPTTHQKDLVLLQDEHNKLLVKYQDLVQAGQDFKQMAVAKAKAYETSHERLDAAVYKVITRLQQSFESATSYPDLVARTTSVMEQLEKDRDGSYDVLRQSKRSMRRITHHTEDREPTEQMIAFQQDPSTAFDD